MDCDDIIDSTMYEKLYKKAIDNDYDVVDCAYYEELSGNKALAINDDVIGDLDDAKRSEIIAGVGNVKEVLYIYKNNANSASHNNREQLKFNDMLAVYRAIGELTYDYNVGEAIDYAKITCIAGAIGICLMNQDNKQFKLEENLLKLRNISNKELGGWQDNIYIQKNMSEDNKEIIKWFSHI